MDVFSGGGNSVKTFYGNFTGIYRLLKGATQDSLYKRRYELMFVALVSVAGESLYQEFMKQEEIVKVLTTTAEKVQQAKDKEVRKEEKMVFCHIHFKQTQMTITHTSNRRKSRAFIDDNSNEYGKVLIA